MAYTNIDDPSAHFQAFTYTGTGSNNSITLNGNSNLQPDLYWYKSRPNTNYHYLADSSRGTTKYIYPNDFLAEGTVASAYVTSFDTNGVTLGGGDSGTNTNGTSFANWVWKANGGTTVSNTDGDITSTVQVNQDAGFSIVTYTGNFTAAQTVGHGLGVRPDVVIIKNRDAGLSWVVWTSELTSGNFLKLNDTAAQSSSSRIYQNGYTTSTFGIGANNSVNKSGNNYIAYCFASKQGYSKFSSYVGNGNANGPFIYTGFKPAFVIMKNYSVGASWHMVDNKRLDYNPTTKVLYANLSNAEGTEDRVDLLSNGFKLRTTNTEVNGNGYNIIYMAFAENPFVTSTGIPTTAR